jgi:hypothetical protein
MRPVDEVARLWNDTLLRLPRPQRMPWSWPLAAAAGGALLTFVTAGSSQVPTATDAKPDTKPEVSASVTSPRCQEQTWPYLSDDCLRHERGTNQQPPKTVRVLQYDSAQANAAIGATEWTRRGTIWAHQSPGHEKQKGKKPKAQDRDQSRSATVRSTTARRDREAAPPRGFAVPESAYRAYGYVRR